MLDLKALQAYIVSDPEKLGLKAMWDAGDHTAIAAALNAPHPLAAPLDVPAMRDQVALALSATELRALSAGDFSVVSLVATGPGLVSSEQLRELAAIFLSVDAKSVTAARLLALATRRPTHAEAAGFSESVDIDAIGAALVDLTPQPPSNPAPSRTFARFVVQNGLIYLPALAQGTLDEGTEFRVSADGFADDQSLPLQFRSARALPQVLLPDVSYFVTGAKGATFAATDTPGGKPMLLPDGGGLIEFPGYTIEQVRR